MHGLTLVTRRQSWQNAVQLILEAREGDDNYVRIYGYSRGAFAAVQIAKALQKRNIDVDWMLLIDPVMDPFRGLGNIKIPTNVRGYINYYQRGEKWTLNDFHGVPSDNIRYDRFVPDGSIPGRPRNYVRHAYMPYIVIHDLGGFY